jgi:hypothetical protein
MSPDEPIDDYEYMGGSLEGEPLESWEELPLDDLL